ncbi:PROTEIN INDETERMINATE-DOMAIN 7 [Salix viminalis]|uniref:PROTEIN INDETERMINATE-DOMAIN 7 n=1 Tax=Salix viminalis TaxID=40686 RepID=A0A9Q0NQV8_SALVM|nr:PROTEIN INDETERMINATE-DOMAIN 7 [Salix viminalis]
MLKGLVMDENISNLTFASGEVSASSGSRIETGAVHPQHSFDSTNQPPPKKKKSFPGNPDPDAEVIALSPNSLQATNRFICEICNKGFKRDQNLQLHRRGHNLPWKLKQRTNKEVKKKVYVCPEITCVHHDPSRALGDLTGIKKHFSRKHGEKKWKCEKCSKRYAVQSDWKAHSRICGTRERDSFITHRAFCDALAEESVRAIAVNPILSSQQPGSSSSHLINLQSLSVKREQDENQHLLNPRPEYSIPPCTNPTVLPPFQYSSTATPHMSATALLQRAAQMGVTMSKPSPSPAAIPRPHQGHMSNQNPGFSSTLPATSTASSGLFLSSREEMGGGFGHGLVSLENKGSAVTSGIMEHLAASDAGGGHSLEHDMMSFLSSASRFDGSSFDSEDFNGMLIPKRDGGNFQGTLSKSTESQFRRTDHDVRTSTAGSPRGGGSDGFDERFLGS